MSKDSDPKPPDEKKDDTIYIEVPYDETADTCTFGGHFQFHASVELRNRLLQVTKALDKKQEKLLSGKRVTEPTHAIQWMAERLLVSQGAT